MPKPKRAKTEPIILGVRPPGRPLEGRGGIRDEFAVMRDLATKPDKPPPGPDRFGAIGRGSGTHLLKFVSPRTPLDRSVLRFAPTGANAPAGYAPSNDAKLSPVAKIVMRPLEIVGRPTRNLIEHVLSPDEASDDVLSAFAEVFGSDSLDALRDALVEPLPDIGTLPVSDFPVVFAPSPHGGDIQITPVGPALALRGMGEVTAPFFEKNVEGQAPRRRGRWHRQQITAHMQNVSVVGTATRTRFLAVVPPLPSAARASLVRYVATGDFPRWMDPSVFHAVDRYAKAVDENARRSDARSRARMDRRADRILDGVLEFVRNVMTDAREVAPDARLAPPPAPWQVVLRRDWKDAERRGVAQRALTGRHFLDRIERTGVDRAIRNIVRSMEAVS